MLMLVAGCGNRDRETAVKLVKVIDIHELKNLISTQTNDVVFLHFWSTYCPPCMDEFPSMITLADKWEGHGVTVLLVSADSRRNVVAVNDYLVKHQMRHPCYVADNLNDTFITAISQNWSGALPASFFLDSHGTIVESWEGTRSYEAYDQVIRNLVNGDKKGNMKP